MWVFPAFHARFPDTPERQEHTALYFAPTIVDADAAQMLDSDVLERRRNVLWDVLEGTPWDERVTACLMEPKRR